MAIDPEEQREKRAAREYIARRRRAHRLAMGYVNPPHGVLSTYTNFLCRCAPCVASRKSYSEGRKK